MLKEAEQETSGEYLHILWRGRGVHTAVHYVGATAELRTWRSHRHRHGAVGSESHVLLAAHMTSTVDTHKDMKGFVGRLLPGPMHAWKLQDSAVPVQGLQVGHVHPPHYPPHLIPRAVLYGRHTPVPPVAGKALVVPKHQLVILGKKRKGKRKYGDKRI